MWDRLRNFTSQQPDAIAVLLLFLLWLIFFWRLLTPVAADQVSIVEGDFSRQFVTFGAYQYERLSNGEIPLWNPYNNGGLPFVADTQAAVFYPPRLLTVAASSLLIGEWTYNALQIEMMTHVLVYTLLVYALIRRLTMGNTGGYASHIAAFIAATIAGYGGFMTGYPPLQLALLEAGIWLPLGWLAILEATRTDRVGWGWMLLAGWALGMSWMAGHPQTSWFATYALSAYLLWRTVARRWRVWRFMAAFILMDVVTLGVAAVMILPGLEYLSLSMRTGLGFTEKGNGFPVQDVMQIIIPGAVSVYSPLFIGVIGLALAGVGLRGPHHDRWFFAILALVALLLSFGRNAALFHALYNVLPGLRFFRGQERAAYLVVNSLAVLAGLGAYYAMSRPPVDHVRQIRRAFTGFTLMMGLLAGAIGVAWLGNPDAYTDKVGAAVFSTLMIASLLLLLPIILTGGQVRWRLVLAVLVVFEITSVTIDSTTNYVPIPPEEQPIMQTPPLVQRVFADSADVNQPLRVEGGQVRGEIGIYGEGNSGSLYGLADIRGISPLFFDPAHAIIQRDMPAEIAWELFAVRYVFTDAEELNVASELIARDYPDGQTLNLHRLSDPRPFALLLTDYVTTSDDAAARDLLRDPTFNPRQTIILNEDPQLPISTADAIYRVPTKESVFVRRDAILGVRGKPVGAAQTTIDNITITNYTPESFTISVNTPTNALLSIAHVDYPGWQVTVDGKTADPIRAYGALVAIPLEAGEHVVQFRYEPLTFTIGAALSLFTWAGLAILGGMLFLRSRGDD